MKKYNLVSEDTKKIGSAVLYRIRAARTLYLQNGRTVLEGELGGYVQSESNLSHDGSCWIADAASAYGKAKVSENAVLLDKSEAYGRSLVFGNATLAQNAKIRDNAKAKGNSVLRGTTVLFGIALASGNDVFENNEISS